MYNEALDRDKNNEILIESGFPPVLKDNDSYIDFIKPVPLYSINIVKGGVEIRKDFYKCRQGNDFHFNPKDGEGLYINDLFASREYAQAVVDRLDFLLNQKVIYEGEEYFVLDWLDPFQVGLNKDFIENHDLHDLFLVRLDKLELSQNQTCLESEGSRQAQN